MKPFCFKYAASKMLSLQKRAKKKYWLINEGIHVRVEGKVITIAGLGQYLE
jgi:hypothetical protein